MMKAIGIKIVLLATLCLSFLSCKKNTSNDLMVFDVNGNYPVKTLYIEDVADIEYLDWNESELQVANKENRLSGKLKAMTESLSEDDECVL